MSVPAGKGLRLLAKPELYDIRGYAVGQQREWDK